ncbi:restriction endonuclease subunit S [Palleronia sp. KMU-117]|uniref:restriction endonuclease subunit S n=1 Tax=Palleronia sp. KMU-117 TaxID=3434108 RepID=UPI003D7303B3
MITLQERVHSSPPPVEWSLNKLHRVLRVRKGYKNIGMREDNLLSLSYGRVIRKDIDSAEGLLPESFETYQVVEPGNIVMRLTDLQNDKRSLRQGLVKERGIITSAYDALELKKGHDPRFWAYTLLGLDLAKYYYSLGGGVRQSIKFSDFPNDWIAAPDTDTQKAIADFLDRETARIDQLVEKKQRFVGLLEEKQAAQIAHFATKGLNPSADLYDTGIDWIGSIPKHWKTRRLGTIFSFRNEKNDPVRTEQILSLSIAHGVTLYSEEEKTGGNKRKDDLSAYKLAFPGDIVLNSMNVIVGAVGRSQWLGAISPVYYALYPIDKSAHVPYFEKIFLNSGFQRGLLRYGKGILIKLSGTGKLNTIRMKISQTDLKALGMPVPPPDEQEVIASFLDKEIARFDELKGKTNLSVKRLKEYSSALTIAAVTGQIDVATWGKRGHADRRLDEIEEAMLG